mgnify:CR=1 FL=1
MTISINTDAHAPDNFDLLRYGISVARRAWIEPKNCLNCLEPDELVRWLRRRD